MGAGLAGSEGAPVGWGGLPAAAGAAAQAPQVRARDPEVYSMRSDDEADEGGKRKVKFTLPEVTCDAANVKHCIQLWNQIAARLKVTEKEKALAFLHSLKPEDYESLRVTSTYRGISKQVQSDFTMGTVAEMQAAVEKCYAGEEDAYRAQQKVEDLGPRRGESPRDFRRRQVSWLRRAGMEIATMEAASASAMRKAYPDETSMLRLAMIDPHKLNVNELVDKLQLW